MITYLKIIVIVLGVMIAAGVVVIGLKLAEGTKELGEISQKANDEAAPETAQASAPPAAGVPLRDLGLPSGSQVRRMMTADRHLVLTISVPNAGERIVIIDLPTGALISNVSLEGTP